jgi:hypothetical protein
MMRNYVFVLAVTATAAGAACDAGSLGGGRPDGGKSGGGPDGGGAQPDALTCESPVGTVSWALTPDVYQVTGVVTHTVFFGGATQITIFDSGGAEYRLDLNLGMPVPIRAGERLEITSAVYRAFSSFHTLDVKVDGVAVLYATQVAQPSLPPPLALEVGDSSCQLNGPAISIHQLRARDEGGEPVIIDVKQQARVGRFSVFNDVILRFPPGAEDATDIFQVVVVRSPR